MKPHPNTTTCSEVLRAGCVLAPNFLEEDLVVNDVARADERKTSVLLR